MKTMETYTKRWAVYKVKPWSADIVGRSTTKAGANRIADRILRRECEAYGGAVSSLYVLEPDGDGECDRSAMQRNDAANKRWAVKSGPTKTTRPAASASCEVF